MEKSHEHMLSRRRFLKQAGAAVMAGVGGLALPARAQTSITYASWVHGHAVIVGENPDLEILRQDNHVVIRNRSELLGTFSTFHFVIPTPVIVNNKRLRIVQVMLEYTPDCSYDHAIRVYDGSSQLAQFSPLLPAGGPIFRALPIPGQPLVMGGIDVEVRVHLLSRDRLSFFSVGADFL
jgi:hypothetical protein